MFAKEKKGEQKSGQVEFNREITQHFNIQLHSTSSLCIFPSLYYYYNGSWR